MKNACQSIKPFLFLLVEATDAKQFMDKKKNIPGKLDELKKENPFSVPEGYFDSFQEKLQRKIRSEEETPARKTAILNIPRVAWISGVAAVFIIGFVLTKGLIGLDRNQPLSQEEIAYAIEQDIYDLDEYELMETLDEMSLEEESGNVYSDEIILYLLDEDIEIDKIVNEL